MFRVALGQSKMTRRPVIGILYYSLSWFYNHKYRDY